VDNDLIKNVLKIVSEKIIKNYRKNNENPLIMNLEYSMKTELLPLDSIFLVKNSLFFI
jgi:hypothetical protein